MKTLDFKTVSPLYEQEKEGFKPFTVRHMDYSDPRFKYLLKILQDQAMSEDVHIRITNPGTGEKFTRQLMGFEIIEKSPNWCILHLGKELL